MTSIAARADMGVTWAPTVPVNPGQAPTIRRATPDDDAALAIAVNMAGEGLPLYLWRQMAGPGVDPWSVGRERARRDHGCFSYANAVVREVDGEIAGCLVGYRQPDTPEPIDTATLSPMFAGLQALENLAPGTWYVNVLATFPHHRRNGHGMELLRHAERRARETGATGLSIIVADTNTAARRLYERLGCREVASRPAVKEDWDNPVCNWVLLTKPF